MKKLITVLSLVLVASTVFADDFQERTTEKVDAVFGLMKCEPELRKNGIRTCEEEIEGARNSGISDVFIYELITKRNLNLSNHANGGLSSWYWVKASVLIK